MSKFPALAASLFICGQTETREKSMTHDTVAQRKGCSCSWVFSCGSSDIRAQSTKKGVTNETLACRTSVWWRFLWRLFLYTDHWLTIGHWLGVEEERKKGQRKSVQLLFNNYLLGLQIISLFFWQLVFMILFLLQPNLNKFANLFKKWEAKLSAKKWEN